MPIHDYTHSRYFDDRDEAADMPDWLAANVSGKIMSNKTYEMLSPIAYAEELRSDMAKPPEEKFRVRILFLEDSDATFFRMYWG